jgi:hypothetical protein
MFLNINVFFQRLLYSETRTYSVNKNMSFPNLDDEITDVTNIGNTSIEMSDVVKNLSLNAIKIDEMKKVIDATSELTQLAELPEFDMDLLTQFVETGKIKLPSLDDNITKIPTLLNELKQQSTITDDLSNDIQKLVTDVGDLSNSVINMKTLMNDSLINYQNIQKTIASIDFNDFKIGQERIIQVKNVIEQIVEIVGLIPTANEVVVEISKIHGLDFGTKFKTTVVKIDMIVQEIGKLNNTFDQLNKIIVFIPQLLAKLKSFNDVLNNLDESSKIFKQIEDFVKLVEQFEQLQTILVKLPVLLKTLQTTYDKLQTIELPNLDEVKKVFSQLESVLNGLTKLNIDDIINNIMSMLSTFDFTMVEFIPLDSIDTIIRWIIVIVLLIIIIPIAIRTLI